MIHTIARVHRRSHWWSLLLAALLALGAVSATLVLVEGQVAVAQARVDINTADARTLQTLPGVGKVTAERIIAYRTEKGPFKTVRDLLNVKGVGEKTLAKFEAMVVVGGGGANPATPERDAEDAELEAVTPPGRTGKLAADDDALIDLTAPPRAGKGKGKDKAGTPAGTPAAAGAIININTATEAELTTLPGIGPAKAKAIITHRQTVGPFKTVDDLGLVKGIGKGTVARLRDRITVQ